MTPNFYAYFLLNFVKGNQKSHENLGASFSIRISWSFQNKTKLKTEQSFAISELRALFGLHSETERFVTLRLLYWRGGQMDRFSTERKKRWLLFSSDNLVITEVNKSWVLLKSKSAFSLTLFSAFMFNISTCAISDVCCWKAACHACAKKQICPKEMRNAIAELFH